MIDTLEDHRISPFLICEHKVIDDLGLSSLAKLLYVVLCRFSSAKDRSAFPSYKTLAQRAGCCESSVQNHLKSLRDAGYIEIHREMGDTHIHHRYVLLGGGGGCPLAEEPEERVISPERKSHEEKIDALFQAFWESYPRRVDKQSARRVFHGLFPFRLSKSRLNARKDNLWAALETYREQREGQDPKYTKHPSTWLRAVDFDEGDGEGVTP